MTPSNRQVAASIVLLAAASRLLPHPPNFTPVAAIALFGGARLGGKDAWWLPLAALALSDLFLGFHGMMPWVYGSFLAIVGIGVLLRERVAPAPLGAAAVASSLLFFLVTNFGVWAGGGLYPMTAEGLQASYAAGLPFLRNTLAGDLFFTAALFGLEAAARRTLVRVPATAA